MIKTCVNCKNLCNNPEEWPRCKVIDKKSFDEYLSQTVKKTHNNDWDIECEHFESLA